MKIFIPGDPVAQPRHDFRVIKSGGRLICKPYIKSDHPIHAFKQAVALAYINAGGELLEGPVQMSIDCYFERPKGHSKKRRSTMEPKWTKPDLDNVAKAALDALNEVAYSDDGQVCYLSVSKFYAAEGDPVGTSIFVSRFSF